MAYGMFLHKYFMGGVTHNQPIWQVWLKLFGFTGIGITLLLAGWITVRLKITLQKIPEPQAILILDGDDQRVRQGAYFAQRHPDLPIWISGYTSQRSEIRATFTDAQVSEQVRYDLRATDTVTHFTTLVDDFVAQEIRYVYLITSDYHMARAVTIATVIFGSRGVAIAPVPQPSQHHPPEESWVKVVRDGLRALLWLATGRSGAQLNPRLQTEASYGVKAERSKLDRLLSVRSPKASPPK